MIPLNSNAGSWNFLSFSFSALMIFWYVAGTAMLPSVPKIVSLLAKVTSGRLFLKSFSANSLVSLIIFWLFCYYLRLLYHLMSFPCFLYISLCARRAACYVSVVQFTVQMSKLNGLGKTYRKRVCSVSEKFARPFTTNKFFERIQIVKEWKFHRLVQL